MVSDTNSLRAESVAGIDKVLTMPIVMRFISEENLRILKAWRREIQNADDVELARVLTYFQQEP
jgi:hypothetical protein